jgi:hypothetical protein
VHQQFPLHRKVLGLPFPGFRQGFVDRFGVLRRVGQKQQFFQWQGVKRPFCVLLPKQGPAPPF